jgi:hypothetical protein
MIVGPQSMQRPAWKDIYLAELRKGRTENVAATLAKVGSNVVFNEKSRNPQFADAVDKIKRVRTRPLRW